MLSDNCLEKLKNYFYEIFLTFVLKKTFYFQFFNFLMYLPINVPIFTAYQTDFPAYSTFPFQFPGRRQNHPFEPIIKTTTKKREKHLLAQPTRCASHDYLPNLEYNFLISYKIQSTSTLPSRAPTLHHLPSLSRDSSRKVSETRTTRKSGKRDKRERERGRRR